MRGEIKSSPWIESIPPPLDMLAVGDKDSGWCKDKDEATGGGRIKLSRKTSRIETVLFLVIATLLLWLCQEPRLLLPLLFVAFVLFISVSSGIILVCFLTHFIIIYQFYYYHAYIVVPVINLRLIIPYVLTIFNMLDVSGFLYLIFF